MKIGFLGNPNNYPLMVAVAMRRAGHDVRFIVDSDYLLHRPEAMLPEFGEAYPDWIIDCSTRLPKFRKALQVEWLLVLADAVLPTRRHRRILGILNSCDAVVVSALGASYLPEIDKPAFAMVVGYDLEVLANPEAPKAVLRRPFDWKYPYRFAVSTLLRRVNARQRAGLRSVRAASFFLRGLIPRGDALLDELGISDGRREFLMMTDTNRIGFVPPPHNEVPRLFVGARLVWKKPLPAGMSMLDDKGTDTIVRGVARYVRKSGSKVELRLVRKGEHVRDTEELVEQEGLSPHVTWLNEMSHAEVLDEFRAADVVFDQLGPGFFGMVALDAMACGRPVICNGRPEILQPVFGVPSPLCQARNEEEVAEQLDRLLSTRAEREDVGKKARAYVEHYFSAAHAAERILQRIGGGP